MKPRNPRTLAEMQRRATAYEVVARHENGTETRLAFTERKTKSVLLRIAQSHGDAIIEMLGSWDGEARYSKSHGWQFGPVRVCFSGRTERDIACMQAA